MQTSRLITLSKFNVRWKFINIYFNYKFKKIVSLSKIILSFSLRDITNDEDLVLIKSLYFLELISSQKAFVKVFRRHSRNKTKQNTLNFLAQVILRKNNMYFFLDLFYNSIIPRLTQKFITINDNIDFKGNLTLVIKDLTVFPSLFLNSLLWSYPLKIDFIFKDSSDKRSYLFFKELIY